MKNLSNFFKNIVIYFAGCGIYSVGLLVFCEPNGISPGGVTGIAVILSSLFGVSKGLLIILLNLPLLYFGYRIFGAKFIINTAIATVILSFTVEIAEFFVKPYVTDKLSAALFGGVLMGCGLGMVLYKGATTGGTDIAARIINRKNPNLSVGRCVLLIDAAVVAAAAYFNGNTESILYSALMLYASSRIIDAVVYGSNGGKMLQIITEKPNEIVTAITLRLGRGATVSTGYGGYTGKEIGIVITAVRRDELAEAVRLIKETDTNAFAIVTDSAEVFGRGFSNS